MTLVEVALAASLLVTDSKGHHPVRTIPEPGAVAVAARCQYWPVPKACAVTFVEQAFQESGYRLDAVGDNGLARGPFQVHGRPMPKTWAQAVEEYEPLLAKSAHTCEEPLELVAAGRCGTKAGKEISKRRMAEVRRILAELGRL